MVVVTVGGESYYLNPKVKSVWDKIKDGGLVKLDEDRVYIVDGREGTGKSVFALQQAAYIDPTIIEDLSRVTFSPEATLEAIRKTKSNSKHTKAIVFDEAFRGLSSKSALSKTNKHIIQALMEMRQNNLALFLVSPSFFLLELYSATMRSNALFHIIKNKNSKRRSFRNFNYKKKAILYQRGIRKGWSYNLPVKIKDNFPNKYPGGEDFRQRYLKKKQQAIRSMAEDEKKSTREEKYLNQRDILIYGLKKDKILTHKSLTELYNKYGVDITRSALSKIHTKITEKQRENGKMKVETI